MVSFFPILSLKDIPFSGIKGLQVGNAQDDDAKTGVTVFYFPTPATAAVKILGGGPASRETPLLDPDRNSLPLNALVFGGGSAYGLAAADGVMRRMEEIGAGYDTGFGIVPIVCQSDIFDLSYGDGSVRPDREMGYRAASEAVKRNDPRSGNVGAGTGATIGKPYGMAQALKSGIGYAACRVGDVEVGVAAVVNAMGDVYEGETKISGMLSKDRDVFLAHCPTSNSNLGSGIAPVTKYIDRRMKLGIGTDIGAGHAVSMIETVRQAVQVSKSLSFSAWMNRGKKASESGSFLPGYTFDALVLDESQLRTWMENLTLTERLERFLYLADDRDIAHKFAAGRRIF